MTYILEKRVFILILLSIGCLAWLRLHTSELGYEKKQAWSADEYYLADKILSGPIPGFTADFLILDVFTLYYNSSVGKNKEYLKLIYAIVIRQKAK